MSRLAALFSLGLLGLAASGCNGCDLTDCSCTSGCFDDCVSECEACSDCADCECACDGCSIVPIPGGYPASERIPQATQVRLSAEGLEFVEQNLPSIVEPILATPALADLLGPGATLDNIRAPIPGVQAVIIEGVASQFISGAAGVCFQSSPTRRISAAASGFPNFAEGYAESAPFTVPEPTAAIVASSAPIPSLVFARHASIQVQNQGGGWEDVCRQDSVFFLGVFSEPLCGADLQPNRNYRITTGIGFNPASLPIPAIDAELFLADNDLCKARVSVSDLQLSAIEDAPDRIRADLAVRVVTANASGAPTPLPVRGFGIVPDCSVSFNTELGPTADLRFRAEVAIVEETSGPRTGIGKLDVVTARFLEPGVETDDMTIGCDGIVGLVLDLFRGPIYGTIEQTIEGLINEGEFIAQVAQIPQAALPDPTNNFERTICPSGSVVDPDTVLADSDGLCYLDTNGNGARDDGENTAAPMLLGAEGRLDMGEFISSFSPGLRSAVDFLFAVDGEGDASGSGSALGYTVDLFAGFNSVQTASCVPTLDPADVPAIPTVAQASAFRGADDSHHISVGVSEEMLNYGAYQLWRSGALCIDVTSRLSDMLTTGLFSLLIPFSPLYFPLGEAPLGIQVRPQRPPVITFGPGRPRTDMPVDPLPDPFVSVSLPSLELHMYVWSSERYVRFMTVTGDLTVNVLRLPLENGVLAFESDDLEIEFNNTVVTNSDAIAQAPEVLASNVTRALAVAPGSVSGSIPRVDVNAALNTGLLPIGVRVADDFIRLVTSDEERFLGVFLDMEVPTAAPFIERADTQVELVRLSLPEDLRAFELETVGQGDLPSVEIAMDAQGPEGVEYEYQYRVGLGGWSDWTRSPYAVISDPSLVLQGRHSVQARARVVGSPETTDGTPARAEFIVDVLAPHVETVLTNAGTLLRANDIVSDAERLVYRFRERGTEAWSTWRTLAANEQVITDAQGHHEFEVRDEAGNVGHNESSLRGLPPPSDGGAGCGDCGVGGQSPTQPLWGVIMLLTLLGLLRRGDER